MVHCNFCQWFPCWRGLSSGTAQRIDGAHSFLTLRPQEGHIREARSVTGRNFWGQALGCHNRAGPREHSSQDGGRPLEKRDSSGTGLRCCERTDFRSLGRRRYPPAANSFHLQTGVHTSGIHLSAVAVRAGDLHSDLYHRVFEGAIESNGRGRKTITRTVIGAGAGALLVRHLRRRQGRGHRISHRWRRWFRNHGLPWTAVARKC